MVQFKFGRNMLTGNDSGPRALSSIVGNVIHTTENSGKTTAMDVAAWMQKPEARASYTGIVDKFRNSVRSNDDNFIPWAAGSTKANGRFLHYSIVGEAKYSRETWLGEYRPALEELAKILAHNQREYGIPLRILTQAQLGRLEKGTTTHNDCSKVFGGSDHWDPGPGFPHDWVLERAQQILNGGNATIEPPKENIVNHDQEIWDQLRGPGGKGWAQLGGRSLVDAVAAIGEKLGIPGMKPPAK